MVSLNLRFIWIALYLHSIYDNQGFPQMRNPMSLTTKYHPATNGQTDNTFDKAMSVKPGERDRSRLKGLLNWSYMTQPTHFFQFEIIWVCSLVF